MVVPSRFSFGSFVNPFYTGPERVDEYTLFPALRFNEISRFFDPLSFAVSSGTSLESATRGYLHAHTILCLKFGFQMGNKFFGIRFEVIKHKS